MSRENSLDPTPNVHVAADDRSPIASAPAAPPEAVPTERGVHPLFLSAVGCGIGLVLSPLYLLYVYLTVPQSQFEGGGMGGTMLGVSIGLRFFFFAMPSCAVAGAVFGAIYGLVKRSRGARGEKPKFRLDDPSEES